MGKGGSSSRPLFWRTTANTRPITKNTRTTNAHDDIPSVGRALSPRPGELQRVLAHECTHALLWSLAPSVVPTWLDEGVAVVFEGENMDWADERLRETRQRLPLADLHGSFSGLTTTQAALAYAEGGLAFERRSLTPYAEFQAEFAAR